jgi:hypothetical protein
LLIEIRIAPNDRRANIVWQRIRMSWACRFAIGGPFFGAPEDGAIFL